MNIAKRLAAAVAVAAGLLTLVVAPQASAAEQPIPGITLQPYDGPAADPDHPAWVLRSGWTGRCLEPDLDRLFQNGGAVHLSTCGNTAAQAWYVTKNPEGYYRFQNTVDGKYIEASKSIPGGGVNGTQVQLWGFLAGAQNQWWKASVNPEGFLRLQNAQFGRYLQASKTVPGGGVDGTKVEIWDYTAGATNQFWK
ncbi:RICIN domain-containing protein [Amycolatopsis sp. OK19-0408]|uniref:RICIN domain-containing protein n=1 Tax=Amycolatopsis iheyensis TaxID=2945988 RepID=A0A9X2SPH2_9PSEU|nr:RICIN domain-containing protein [Amycolatopsis iheyensis]MCR6490102.1 RICIN domain-containing protein [Amycolatopsis iheyensis]